MKTPMQEMIEVIKEKLKVDTLQYNARPSNGSLIAIRISEFYLEMAESMLEKEKDAIIEAHKNGYCCCNHFPNLKLIDAFADDYYKDTFTK